MIIRENEQTTLGTISDDRLDFKLVDDGLSIYVNCGSTNSTELILSEANVEELISVLCDIKNDMTAERFREEQMRDGTYEQIDIRPT